MKKWRESTEQTEITEQTEDFRHFRPCFRLFRYFRLFRILLSSYLPLSRFGDFARFEAAGANFDAPRRAVDDSAHALQIRLEAAFGAVVGVRHAISELRAFAAD